MTYYKYQWTYKHVPLDHDYRDENGKIHLRHLKSIAELNSEHARDFQLALNSLCSSAPLKDYVIKWSIEEIEK